MAKKTILVVEDDSSLKKIIGLKLKQVGYNVLLSQDGEEAIKIIKERHPDLVWLDIYLPKANGLEILKKIRKDAKLKDTDVIVVTVSSSINKKELAEKLAVKDYLVKSNYPIDGIVDKVAGYLKKKK